MNLRKLSTTTLLTCVLGIFAFAGATRTLACEQPRPGQTLDPPCAQAPGDANTPTVTSTTSIDMSAPTAASDETSLTEIAAKAYLTFLSLF